MLRTVVLLPLPHWLNPTGDEEIRTLDPLLARQVLSQLSYIPFFCSGARLLSHAVSSAVPSAARALTVVFGMGTGVSPGRIGTGSLSVTYLLVLGLVPASIPLRFISVDPTPHIRLPSSLRPSEPLVPCPVRFRNSCTRSLVTKQ